MESEKKTKDKIDWNFIRFEEEGNQKISTKGYIPRNSKTGQIAGQSGVTIAVGFDIGQRNEYDLKQYNFPPELYEKLKPYLNKKKEEAESFLEKNPLSLSIEEANLIYERTQSIEGEKIIKKYNALTGKKFEDLPSNYQTVLVSNGYQFGNNSQRFKNLCSSMSKPESESMSEVIEILENDKNYLKRRRNEINLIKDPDFTNYK